ncbi:MAG: nicotinamide-nucleotide amidohydrolase family protein [Planctomycetota bacterium]
MDFESLAAEVAETLAGAGETGSGQTLVLAESCTAGLIAATLSKTPGASAWLAGALVVYQEASKSAWLGVDAETIEEQTAVSAPVAHQMVTGALQQTPHASLAAAVTGHLGPNAPEGFDGKLFIAVCRRGGRPRIWEHQLEKTKRVARQREAATLVLQAIATECQASKKA